MHVPWVLALPEHELVVHALEVHSLQGLALEALQAKPEKEWLNLSLSPTDHKKLAQTEITKLYEFND